MLTGKDVRELLQRLNALADPPRIPLEPKVAVFVGSVTAA